MPGGRAVSVAILVCLASDLTMINKTNAEDMTTRLSEKDCLGPNMASYGANAMQGIITIDHQNVFGTRWHATLMLNLQ